MEVEVVEIARRLESPGTARDTHASHAWTMKHVSHLCCLQLPRGHSPLAYLAMTREGAEEVRQPQETQAATSSVSSSAGLSR